MTLYLKHRPTNFDDVKGQLHISITLRNAFKLGRISHAYLFCGPKGTGKTTSARIVAKAINCLNLSESGDPCDTCTMCRAFIENKLPDVIEIDAASNRGIDEIRNLKEEIKYMPTIAKAKVYIIDEVHMLSKEAFNALLKTLEEPPAHVYFILATTEHHKVPETIRSRCQNFDFHRVTEQDIVGRLQTIAQIENYTYDKEALDFIAKRCDGALRDAIGLMEQALEGSHVSYKKLANILGIASNETVETLIESMFSKNEQKSLELIHGLYAEGYDLNELIKDILFVLRKKLLNSVENRKPIEDVLKCIEFIQDASSRLRSQGLPQLSLEIAVLKFCSDGKESVHPIIREVTVKQDQPKNEVKEMKIDDTQVKDTEMKTVEHPGTSSNTEDLKNTWGDIIKSLPTPAMHQDFRQGKVLKFENDVLELGFHSKFNLERATASESKHELQKLLEERFHRPIKLQVELIEPSLTPNVHDITPQTVIEGPTKLVEDDIDTAVSIFSA